MAKNTHYCIIDHMGSLTKEEIAEVYATANKMAKDAGFDKPFTIKAFANRVMPRARNIDGAKWVIRNNRNPELVLFICPNDLTAKVKSGIRAWEREGIKVVLVQPKKYRPYTPTAKEAEMYFAYGDYDSKRRMIASIWAPALGYTFQNPFYRDNTDDPAGMFIHQSSLYSEVDSDDLTTYSTRGETFLEAKRTVVSEKELDEFMQFYKAVRNSEMPIEEFLDPDWKICPVCGRPYRCGEGSSVSCPRCDFETEDVELTSYWDDRGEEPEEASGPRYNPYDIGFDTDESPNFFAGIPVEHKPSTDRSGSATFVSTNYDETWRWYSTWEDNITR